MAVQTALGRAEDVVCKKGDEVQQPRCANCHVTPQTDELTAVSCSRRPGSSRCPAARPRQLSADEVIAQLFGVSVPQSRPSHATRPVGAHATGGLLQTRQHKTVTVLSEYLYQGKTGRDSQGSRKQPGLCLQTELSDARFTKTKKQKTRGNWLFPPKQLSGVQTSLKL